MMPARSTPETKAAFCTALVVTGGNVSAACKAVGISRTTPYTWTEEDPEFEAAWERAKKMGAEVLEDAARERAFSGVTEPIYYLGSQVGTIQKYSDTLTIFLLKGAMPEKYRERTDVNVRGDLNVVDAIRAGRARVGM